MNESQATSRILKKLKEHGHFWKCSDRFVAGVPDIVGLYKGRFAGIEMKVDYNHPSAIQIHTMLSIAKHGGYAGVVTYNNKSKKWWLLGKAYTISEVVVQIIKRIEGGGNDLEN
jgi:hypothetical protein